MTAQNGTFVLIKVGDGAAPEAFSTIGGLRTSKITLENQPINASNIQSGQWRQLISSGGLSAMTIEGSGLFTNSASEETLRGYAFAGTVNNYKFYFANGNNVSGPFLVTHYERHGDHDEAEMFFVALESAGTLTFAMS